jgi:hypothetical protein
MSSTIAIRPAGIAHRRPVFRRARKPRGDAPSGTQAAHLTPGVPAGACERRLFLTALQVRAFLEPVWLEWHTAGGNDVPSPLSRSTCGRSSLFLMRVLQSSFPPAWCLRAWFGFHAGSDWQSHAWVEASDWIIDLTADQFGDEPVIVVTRPDPRYQKGVCDSAYPEFVRAHRYTVERLWLRWQAWCDRGNAVPGRLEV